MSNRTATTFSPFPRPSAALPYPKHGRRRVPAPMRSLCIYIYGILFVQGFGQEFFVSRLQYAIRGTAILGQIASFERRLRGAAQTPLALPCPFRTST